MLKLQKSLSLLVSLLLVASFFSGALPSTNSMMAKAQPILVQMAASNPNQTVSVIIQKVNQTTSAEEQVTALGGQVTQDLGIINAFSAEMTGGAAIEISRSADVRWVSLDAAVKSSTCTACIDTTNLTNAYIRTIRA